MPEPWEEFAAAKTSTEEGPWKDFTPPEEPWKQFQSEPTVNGVTAKQGIDTTRAVLDAFTGPTSLAFANQVMDDAQQPQPDLLSGQPTITSTPTFGGELKDALLDATSKGTYEHIRKAGSIAYEALRRPLSGVMGPTESERIEKSVPFGKDAAGNPVYEFKPLGNRLDREGGLFTPFAEVKPLAAKEGDSAAAASGKAVFNTIAGLENSFLSPAGVALPIGSQVQSLGRVGAGLFGADMLAQAPGQLERMFTGGNTQEKIEGGLGLLSSLLLGRAAIKEAVKGHTPSIEETRAATEAGMKALAPDQTLLTREQPHSQVTDTSIIDGLVETKNIIRQQFDQHPPEVQSVANKILDEIDSQLGEFSTKDVTESQKRIAEKKAAEPVEAPPADAPTSSVPLKAPTTPPGSEPPPLPETVPSVEVTKVEPVVEASAASVVDVDPASPEFIKASTTLNKFRGIAEAAAEKAGALSAEDAVSDAILGSTDTSGKLNIQGSLAAKIARGEIKLEDAKKVLIAAAENQARNQLAKENTVKRGGGKVESLDAPVGEGETPLGESIIAPEKTRAFDSDAQAVLDQAELTPAERRIVDAVKGGQYESVAEAARDLGITEQAAGQSFNSALQKLKSMGPGAASAYETLAHYEIRKFGERFTESKDIEQDIRDNTGNKYYEPIPNRVTAEEATKIIDTRGVDESTSLIRDEKNDLTPAVRSTMGQLVIKKLNEQYKALKETDPAAASKVLDKAVDLAEWQMEYGTRLGQGVQSFAMWSRLTPEGKLRTYVKAVEKARTRVEKETDGGVKKVAKAAKEISEADVSKEKQDAIDKEADRIAKQLSDTPEFGKKPILDKAKELIQKHLNKEVDGFQEKIIELGAKEETAASIDRMAAENRKRISKIDREKRIEALRNRLLKEKNPLGKKLKKSTVEKIMDLADDGLLKDEAVWDAVSKDLGLPDFSPETAKEIARLSAEVDTAAEGIPRNEAMARLTNFMASKKGFASGDLPMAIYYGNILSGYNTHIVNALDTGLNVMSELGTMALSNPKAIPSIVRGVVRGLGEGKADALLALSEGRRVVDGKYAETPGLLEASEFGKKGGVPIQTKTLLGKTLKAAAESKIAYPLNAYKYVGRLMSASDTIFYRAAEEAKSSVLAYKEAVAKGVEKAELRAEADKMLGYDRIDEFREQAKAEGFTGTKADARATELMQQSRPENLREEAGDFAGVATYNHAPEGLLGYFSNKLSEMTTRVPPLKLIVPFTRIVANVTNRGLDWTPYGYKRALAGRGLFTEGLGEGPMLGDARTAMLAKATAGTVGLAALAVLNQIGAVQVHGGGPSDPERKRQLKAAGWKPYTLQIGDTYLSYAPTPMGLGVSALGNFLDANRYHELGQKDLATRTAYAVSRLGSTVFNQSFLAGLSNVFEALSSDSPGKQISSMKRILTSAATGFTVPNLAKDINRIFDPNFRDSDSIAEDLVRDIPVARLALRPSLNAYGDPVEQPSNRFVSFKKSSPEWRIVVNKNLRIPVADETTFTTPEAGYEYQKLAGQGMKDFVKNRLPALQGMTADQAQEAITSASGQIFQRARAQVRSKFPNSLKQRK